MEVSSNDKAVLGDRTVVSEGRFILGERHSHVNLVSRDLLALDPPQDWTTSCDLLPCLYGLLLVQVEASNSVQEAQSLNCTDGVLNAAVDYLLSQNLVAATDSQDWDIL